MNTRTSIRRFTLIELLVGTLAATVLALVATVMFLYAHTVWLRLQDQARAQEDGAAAVATIAHMLRQASSMPAPAPGVPRVEITTATPKITIGRGTAMEASVFVSNNSLIYSRQGHDEVLVANRLVPGSFTLIPIPDSPARTVELAITMRLTTQGGEIPVESALFFRN